VAVEVADLHDVEDDDGVWLADLGDDLDAAVCLGVGASDVDGRQAVRGGPGPVL